MNLNSPYVGGHKSVGQMIRGISDQLNIPHAADHHGRTDTPTYTPETLPQHLKRRIADDNRLDQALFERWGQRGWQQQSIPNAPSLSKVDQARYLWGDAISGLWKSLPTRA